VNGQVVGPLELLWHPKRIVRRDPRVLFLADQMELVAERLPEQLERSGDIREKLRN
jgi:hypothetical protein